MLKYYQERNGDYLCIETTQVRKGTNQKLYSGRATAIRNDLTSVCTTEVGSRFLMGCQKRKLKDVPKEWQARFF